MAVIRCQACGKPNPDFLEACQYCEAPLKPAPSAADETLARAPASTVRCQACGRSNPDHLENCQYCEARLKPPPAEPPAASDPLAQLRASQTFAREPDTPETEAPSEAPAAWINRLRGAGGSPGDQDTLVPPSRAAAEPEPEWMFTLPGSEPPRTDEPTWLRDEPPPPADTTRASDEDDLPDWLRDLRSSAAAAAPIQPDPTEPFFPTELPPTPPTVVPPPASGPGFGADDDLPEWLRGEEASTRPPLSPQPHRTLSDWISPGTAQPAADELAASAEPSPAAAAAGLEPPAPASLEAGAPGAADQTLIPPSTPRRRKKMTDWLTPPEGGLPPQIPAPKPAEPEAELPDWLKAMQPAEEVPDWLRDVATAPRSFNRPPASPETSAAPAAGDSPPTPPAPTPAATPTPEAELPAWLKTLRASPAPEPDRPDTATNLPLPTIHRQQSLPAWLKGVTGGLPPEAPTPPAETPTAQDTDTAAPILPTPGAAPPAAEATLPWLQPDADEPAPEAEAPAAVPGDYELPDWLRPSPEALAAAEAELAAEPPVDPAQIHAAELARAQEELPDWLRNLQAKAPETELPATGEAGTEPTLQPDPAVPAWLRPAGPSASPPEPSDTPAAAGVPEWLQNLQTQSSSSPTLPTGDQAADLPPLDDETLAWLTTTSTQATTADETPDVLDRVPVTAWPDEAQAVDGIPAALDADGGADDVAAAEPTAVEDMPDWLKALRGVSTKPQEPAEAMPDWLRALRGIPPAPDSATTPSGPHEPAEPAERETSPAGATADALPGWLAAMRPTDVEHPAEAEADAYEENIGVLAGMRGVLRAEPTVAQPHKATSPVQQLIVTESHAAQAKVLASLLQEEGAARPLAKQPTRLSYYVERWLVFLTLALAILVPQFLLPGMFAAPKTISREAQAAFEAVNDAPISQPALVAFDYDPAEQGELSPSAVAIVTHLMSRGVPVVAVSTRPLGAAVAESVLDQVAAQLGARAQVSYTYGTQYLNLGYISGGPVGLLQFAAAPQSVFQADFSGDGPATVLWTQPILRGVNALEDFGLIVLVTAAPDDTRAWIEQTENYARGVPRLAVVSAGAEPMVRPYIEGDLPQLNGLVAGLVGAAQYEQYGGVPGLASRNWGALGGGLWAAVLLIAGGNAVYASLALLRRRRR